MTGTNADGNGRTGRLWQSLILQSWKDIFAWLPVETLVHERQEEYYDVLWRADKAGDSTVFVEFMLQMIRDALKEVCENQNRDVVVNVAINVVTNEDKVLALLKQGGNLTANVLSSSLGLTLRQVQWILANLKEAKRIVRHGASKNGYWKGTE